MALAAGPTIPASESKKGERVNLDQPPPLPTSLRTPDVSGLAGTTTQSQTGTPPTGDMATMVAQQGMLIEKAVGSLAQMLPGFAPSASQIIAILRTALVASLQQSSQGQGGAGAAPANGAPGGGGPLGGGAAGPMQ